MAIMALEIEGYTYITHKLINRPWGPEIRFTMARPDGSHINAVLPIPSMDATNQQLIDIVSAYLARLKEVEDMEATQEALDALVCRVFDNSGEELQKALRWIVRKVRQYPNATITQAANHWNAECADSLFTWDKLIAYVQQRLGNLTWAAFKAYVIEHRFEGVD